MGTIYHDDTIAAIATPLGEGAIAIIRVSGPEAIRNVDGLFCGKSKLTDANGYTVHFGRLVDGNSLEIDDVLVTIFRNPNSYTGEDSVEVSCHGGLYVTQKVLATIIATGIRQAEPGEFTKRAFLNGKMDLSQAEAVADLIAATSEASHRFSLNQLEGRFSDEIRKLKRELLDLSSLIELELDFSEEGIDPIPKEDVLDRITRLMFVLQAMVDSYRMGKVYREGVSVAIVGKSNAGKSSLFNALLKESRAIVAESPGTTRDTLEESVFINGILFRLTDTAGLRQTTDPVELEGVSRAKGTADQSDLIIDVVDASGGMNEDEGISFLQEMRKTSTVILAHNKMDLVEANGLKCDMFKLGAVDCEEVFVSAKTGQGLDVLRTKLVDSICGSKAQENNFCVTSGRHKESLAKSVDSLRKAKESLERGSSSEFVAVDVRSAADALSEIVGEITSEDTLNNIFQHFCIGK